MRTFLPLAAAIATLAIGGVAQAAQTVTDPAGDFLSTYTGPALADLDVVSFSVDYNSTADIFTLSATMAGAITAGTDGFYVIGVNTGTGPIRPFGSIGNPNVIFNQAIRINKDGTATLGATALSNATISGSSFSISLARSLFPTTGFAPERYGFNLWPRVAGGVSAVADFAPNNANLASVPEPATWAMMLTGFGLLGGALRRRRTTAALTA